MTIELIMLGCSIILGLVQLFLAAGAATSQRGNDWNLGTREAPAAPLTGVHFRLDQAFQNFKETFPFFAAAVLAVQAGGRWSVLSMIGVHVYFWARVAYLPIYAIGIKYLRSLVWTISIVGIVLVLISLF